LQRGESGQVCVVEVAIATVYAEEDLRAPGDETIARALA